VVAFILCMSTVSGVLLLRTKFVAASLTTKDRQSYLDLDALLDNEDNADDEQKRSERGGWGARQREKEKENQRENMLEAALALERDFAESRRSSRPGESEALQYTDTDDIEADDSARTSGLSDSLLSSSPSVGKEKVNMNKHVLVLFVTIYCSILEGSFISLVVPQKQGLQVS